MNLVSKSLLICILFFTVFACGENANSKNEDNRGSTDQDSASAALVTFIELGSVNCIPCRQMQPVMKAIEEKYGEQVKVIFYDVWKKDQAHYATQYGIKLIPTQIFLDQSGKEFFRHEGFFPEEQIDQIVQRQGLKPKA